MKSHSRAEENKVEDEKNIPERNRCLIGRPSITLNVKNWNTRNSDRGQYRGFCAAVADVGSDARSFDDVKQRKLCHLRI